MRYAPSRVYFDIVAYCCELPAQEPEGTSATWACFRGHRAVRLADCLCRRVLHTYFGASQIPFGVG